MSRQSFIFSAAIALGLAFAGASAMAASGSGGSSSGGGGGGGGSGSGASLQCREGLVPDSMNQMCVPCETGKVYDTQTKACVTRSSGLIDDHDLYVHGRELALAGQYQSALDVFAEIGNKNDAMVLTMIGYSTRKLGHTEEGIAIYHQALAIDPNNVNTHEYLGEGYLAAGRVDLAEAELDTLQRLCGTDCEQYSDLKNALIGEGVWN